MSTVQVSSFSIPDYKWAGSTAKLRLYANRDWTDSLGVPHIHGSPGSSGGFYQEIPCTIVDGSLVVPTFSTPSTVDSIPLSDAPKVNVTAVIFDAKNAKRETLFSQWRIPAVTPTTWTALLTYNQSRVIPLPADRWLTADEVQNLIDAALGTLNDASDVVKGRTYLDVAPALATSPIAVGSNSPRVGYQYYARLYASFAAAITAIGATEATLVVDTSLAVTVNQVVPRNVTLRFSNAGMLNVSAGITLTVKGPIDAHPRQQIFTGLGSFSGISFQDTTLVAKTASVMWWGAKGDGTTDDTVAIQSALNVFTTGLTARMGGYLHVPNGTYIIKNTLWYLGNASNGIRFEGELGNPRGFQGTTFQWAGAAGGAMVYWGGANGSQFRNLSLNGASIAKYGLWLDATNTYAASSTATVTTLSRASNVVTVTTSAAHGFTSDDMVFVSGMTDQTFTQYAQVTVTGATTFTYSQTGTNGSATGGTAVKNKSGGSSGIFVDYSIFYAMTGSGSAGILLGHSTGATPQVDTFTFDHITIQGNPPDMTYGVRSAGTGNVKHWTFYSPAIVGVGTAISATAGGSIVIINPSVGSNFVADFTNNGSSLTILGGTSEFSEMLVKNSGGTADTSSVTVLNMICTFNPVATDDYIIAVGGHLHLEGNTFRTNRDVTAIPKIKTNSGATGSVVSIGNYFIQDTGALPTYAPIYDSSDNLLATDDQTFFGGANLSPILSMFDKVSNIGGVPVKLKHVQTLGGVWRLEALRSTTVNTSYTGWLRAAKTDALKFRNEANSADISGVSKETNNVVKVGDTMGILVGTTTFAALPASPTNGTVVYVSDGTPASSPLTGAGSGCLAIRQNGAWRGL